VCVLKYNGICERLYHLQNSLASAFPHLLTWVVSIILTQLGDYCIRKQYAKTGTVRKVCNTIGNDMQDMEA